MNSLTVWALPLWLNGHVVYAELYTGADTCTQDLPFMEQLYGPKAEARCVIVMLHDKPMWVSH